VTTLVIDAPFGMSLAYGWVRPLMGVSLLRSAVCWAMVAIFPPSVFAADSGAAMLYANGMAWLNGAAVPRSSAIFPGDMVQTRADSIANINAAGSNVMVLADSLIKFESQTVSLDHGSVSVATSKGMTTKAGKVTVSPASNAWTEFQVTDVNGTVQIVAQKGDVSVSDQSGTLTLAQGQQTTRDESSQPSKKKKRRRGGAPVAGMGSIMDSKAAMWIGAGVAGGVAAWVLLQSDDPMSPDGP
jgi:hypothetical protein